MTLVKLIVVSMLLVNARLADQSSFGRRVHWTPVRGQCLRMRLGQTVCSLEAFQRTHSAIALDGVAPVG
eukprot:7311147-Karenia_brevis.AAC.1